MSKLPILVVTLVTAMATGCGDSVSESESTHVATTAAISATPETTITTTSPPSTTQALETTPAPTTPTPASTTGAPGATIGQIATAAQRFLDDQWEAEPNKPEGVLGAVEIVCTDRSDTVLKGDAFACAGVPRTKPDFQLDSPGLVFAVLDDEGTVSFAAGTDLPNSTGPLYDIYDRTPTGLFCRDLDDDGAGGFFSTCCGTPRGNYFRAVLYWFMEGMPDRMDADRNGVPCETLFPADVVDAIWRGGPVR